MNNDAFKKILEDALNPLREDIRSLKSDLSEIKDTQEERVLPTVTYIEQNIKTYADMYKMNNDNMKKLEKRVETLEDHSGIQAPPELTLAEVQ